MALAHTLNYGPMNRSLLVSYAEFFPSSDDSIHWRKYSLIQLYIDWSIAISWKSLIILCFLLTSYTCVQFVSLTLFHVVSFGSLAAKFIGTYDETSLLRHTHESSFVMFLVLFFKLLLLLLCFASFIQLLLYLRLLLCTFFCITSGTNICPAHCNI